MRTLFLLLISLLLAQCADVYSVSADFKVLGRENSEGKFIAERDPTELIDFMQAVVDDIPSEATSGGRITEAFVQKVQLADETEQYFLFAREELPDHLIATVAIGLTRLQGGTIQFSPGKTCVHRCTASGLNPCSGNCNMTILEPCARVLCSCSSEGSCNAEIVISYPD